MKWNRMNVMERERIINNAAKSVFDGTEYDWADMLENLGDREAIVKRKNPEEDEAAAMWKEYFQDMLVSVRWSEEN